MSTPSSVNILHDQASTLINRLVSEYDPKFGMGSMSCAIYDTAWVSMVAKNIDGREQWLFPECFRFILEHQLESGGWQSYAAQVDSILNSLAALLAFKKHAEAPNMSPNPLPTDLDNRIERAVEFLKHELNNWNVQGTTHVGFEILVPSLLELLEQKGVHFEFAGRSGLMDINKKKLSRLDPAILYTKFKCTAIHSLEAFIGKIDFNKVKHHKTFGSMMASPSSTAAYLINATEWDVESEEYLRQVVTAADGKGSGGVPSAFPSTYFEYTWVTSTLLKGGFTIETLGAPNLHKVAEILENGLQAENGLLGFAPFVGADADDTAFAITTLNLLGRPTAANRLIQEFEASDHFKTYAMERNPSLSANCNVLNALLNTPDPSVHFSQIEKCIKFLCSQWWTSDGKIEDKWNLTEEYTMMLLAQAFVKVLSLWEQKKLEALDTQLLRDKALVVLFQALIRILQSQQGNGSWSNCFEATAYAVIALANLASLPFIENIRHQVNLAVQQGREYLNTRDLESGPEYLWIEKVTYGSNSLSQAYRLSALNVSTPTFTLGEDVLKLTSINSKAITKFSEFFSRLPLYSATPKWRLQASLVEGYLFLPMIKHVHFDIFPRDGMAEDKYLEYIPFTWTGANNRDCTYLTAEYLHEMMVLSMLAYQCDEYMEAVAGRHFEDRLQDVRNVISHIFNNPIPSNNYYISPVQRSRIPSSESETIDITGNIVLHESGNSLENESLPIIQLGICEVVPTNDNDNLVMKIPTLKGEGTKIIRSSDSDTDSGIGLDDNTPSLKDVANVLGKFANHILNHPTILKASRFDQDRLRRELKIFLLAHVKQTEDNTRFGAQNLPKNRSVLFETPTSSYYSWVQSTSSDHTSCPFAFAFVSCLLSKGGKDFCSTAEEKYVAEDLCRQLAVTCRQYNDYGSIPRDRDEKNLNSINFPEFFTDTTKVDDTSLKTELYQIAMFEKKKLDMSVQTLEQICTKNKHSRVSEAIKMFVNVTDTYGQIYMVRDIASRM